MFDFNKNFSNAKLCNLFIEHGNLKSDGIDIICQCGCIYHTIPSKDVPTELRKLVTPETRMEISPFKLNTIADLIRQNPDIRVDTSICNSGNVIFRNGVYSAVDGKLHPHTGVYNWAIVDAEYIEGVRIEDAPVFLHFVNSSLEYQTEPKKTELLLEIIGYCLSDYIVAKKAFFFKGEPSSGKSKFLEFLQRLIGDESVSQISLPLIGSRFSLGQLRGKRLNICTELPSNKFPSIAAFKALTACDRVYGEEKGKDGFSYYPRVKLLNAGNNIPFPANTDGTFSITDRMVFLLFNYSIPREHWNLTLVDDLILEKDVICSLAMQRLKHLAESNFGFAVPEDSELFARSYTESMNAFDIFISECCEVRANTQISSQQLWENYESFCTDNAFPKGINRQLFAQKVESINGVKKQRVRDNRRQITVFKGISMLSTEDEYKKTRSNNKKREYMDLLEV